ncbi:NifB/NifX family molybdenum-iron cluster-binding protein [candidate division KSB1 bacterium]|nr:NifB/NifX family molybdenum-iron cluster-binding protein [candidate division KSB1 bacterium]
MKIAISTDNGRVSAHFGRCPEFTIIDIENSQISNKEVIANPGHHPGYLPDFLHERGVEVMIAGGAGTRAQMLFEQKNIHMILGVEGQIDIVIDQLCKGELKGGESLCSPGAGKGYGLDKDECDHDEGHHH